MVLLLSEASNDSVHVLNEVERAVSKRKRIFMMRIQDVTPSKDLELHVSSAQWIEAWESGADTGMTTLSDGLREFFEEEGGDDDDGAQRRRRWRARLRALRRSAKRFGMAAGIVGAVLGAIVLWLAQASSVELEVHGPAAADVSLGGRLVAQVGSVPRRVSVPPGEHRLQIEAPGYWPYERTVTVERGATNRVEVALMPISTLRVAVTPPNATVSVDGRPIDAQGGVQLRDGNHVVDVAAPGYKPERRTVPVANGQRQVVTIALETTTPVQTAERTAPRPRADDRVGRLSVTVGPPDAALHAAVRIDGRSVGRETRLPAGVYGVEITAAGYEPYRDTVEVTANETARVSVTLGPLAAAEARTTGRGGFAENFAPEFGKELGRSLGRSIGGLPGR